MHRALRASKSHARAQRIRARARARVCGVQRGVRTHARPTEQRKSPSDQQCGNGERLRATLCESRTTRALETTYLYPRGFVRDRPAARTFPSVEIGRPSRGSNVLCRATTTTPTSSALCARASFNRLTAIRVASFFRV